MTGWTIITISLIAAVIVIGAYWNGRLSARSVNDGVSYVTALFSSEAPESPLPVPEAVPKDVDEVAVLKDSIATLEHHLMLAENTNQQLTREINAMKASKPEKVACDPVVKWRRYCPKEKLLLEGF